MSRLRERMNDHAEKVRKQEEMEAALAGVFSQEVQASRERFATLVQDVVKPAFDEFKKALRDLGRDAVIVVNLTHNPQQSIVLTLVDKYLSFGVGKTLKLVNPKEDVSKAPNTKFYEILSVCDAINVRQRVDPKIGILTTEVPFDHLTEKFLEEELAAFFERAYPTPSPDK